MDARRSTLRPLLLIALVTASGCAHRARNTDLLEVELRHLEDQIYCMEDEVTEAHRRYDAICAENEQLREQLERAGQTVEPTRRPPLFPGLAPRNDTAPSYDSPSSDSNLGTAPPFEAPPTIQPPNANTPEGVLPSLPPTDGLPPTEPTPGGPPAVVPDGPSVPGGSADAGAPHDAANGPEPLAAAPTEVDPAASGNLAEPRALPGAAAGDPTVTNVTLNLTETHGLDADGQPGHEALAVVVEPRNTAGEIVPAPAEISIVVLDPAQQGAAARVARWNFSPDEAQEHVRADGPAAGLHFELAWPDRAPANKSLMLFVRYTLANREQFVIDQPIEIDPPAIQAYQPSQGDWNRAERTAGVPTPAAPPQSTPSGGMPQNAGPAQRGPMARMTQRGGYAPRRPQHQVVPQSYESYAPPQQGYAPRSRGGQWSRAPRDHRAARQPRGFQYSDNDGGWGPGR